MKENLFTNEKETKRAIKAAVDQFRKFLKYNKWKDSKKKVISGSAYEINADGTEVENESTK